MEDGKKALRDATPSTANRSPTPPAISASTTSSNNDSNTDSDSTMLSDDDTYAGKTTAEILKEYHLNRTQLLDQILKAHSERKLRIGNFQDKPLVFETLPDGLNPMSSVRNDAGEPSGAATNNVGPTCSRHKCVDRVENNVDRRNAADEPKPSDSLQSIGSIVCRICHNAENPEGLVSPCLCKGSLAFVHIHCLERWIATSRSTTCELCQFQYRTVQTLRYTCLQSLRIYYSRPLSRRALQEDCQMFSLLTLVAFGIIGTLLVGLQYYFLQGNNWGLGKLWTKGWLLFFLFSTVVVYFINIYMIIRAQLSPWYRWWQSARNIELVLENCKPLFAHKKAGNNEITQAQLAAALNSQSGQQQQSEHQSPEQNSSVSQTPTSLHVPQAVPTNSANESHEMELRGMTDLEAATSTISSYHAKEALRNSLASIMTCEVKMEGNFNKM